MADTLHYSLFIILHSPTEDLRNQWNSFLIQQQIPDARKSVSCQVKHSQSLQIFGLWLCFLNLEHLSGSSHSQASSLYYTEVSYILHRYFWLPLNSDLSNALKAPQTCRIRIKHLIFHLHSNLLSQWLGLSCLSTLLVTQISKAYMRHNALLYNTK